MLPVQRVVAAQKFGHHVDILQVDRALGAAAVILLDVVLGYGSNMDPAAELAPVIRAASRKVPVVCSVTGTDGDPQNRSRVVKALKAAGAIVMPSNAAACAYAGNAVKAGGK